MLSFVAGGCAPLDLTGVTPRAPALSRIVEEAPGAACEAGGSALQTGLDLDGDGTLADSEVTRTEYVCDKAPARSASVLARVRPVNATPVCYATATVLEAGADANGNGALDDAEVQASHAFCNADSTRIRYAVQPEPADGRCGRPGTKVDAYVDLDGDGQRTPDTEDLVTLAVCQASRVHDGDYVVASAADLAALQGVTRVEGNLVVTSETLTDLALPELAVVLGALRIENNAALAHVTLPGLRFARSVELIYNPLLETASLGASAASPVFVDEDLIVTGNPLLASLDGLGTLAPRRKVSVVNNARVEALSLPGVTHLHEGLSVQENPALRSLSFPELRSAGYVSLAHDASLESLAGLSAVRSVESLLLIDLPALGPRAALDNLQYAQSISVAEHTGIKSVGFPQLLRVDVLDIRDNASLESVSGMHPMLRVTTSLLITGNGSLHTVEYLPGLTSLDYLDVTRNAVLTDLGGLRGLVLLKSLSVHQNGQLQTLASLSGLREIDGLAVTSNPNLQALGLEGLTRVASSFTVQNNLALPECLAGRLADRVYTGPPAQRTISGNDAAAPCTPP
ncbi:hypothetical protein D7W81_25085 [Corallococcus aberystwythensis]|uniref:DUF7151 domain-containing protein n=1 Tax=Corallococcus aberystwythensis TaxID=2316722 RepID=A0A3A8PXQ9_9BACT|nr:hypothetical protein D7W81_25085 [Corallococcus aberystwythensis]